MAELLWCVDRWYRDIVLFEDTWYDKIVAEHHVMTPHLELLEQALRDPDIVTYDVDYPNGENFYRTATLARPYGHVMVKVCVRFRLTSSGEELGTIVTAYPAFSIK